MLMHRRSAVTRNLKWNSQHSISFECEICCFWCCSVTNEKPMERVSVFVVRLFFWQKQSVSAVKSLEQAPGQCCCCCCCRLSLSVSLCQLQPSDKQRSNKHSLAPLSRSLSPLACVRSLDIRFLPSSFFLDLLLLLPLHPI